MKNQVLYMKKSFPQKTIPKIVSMIVQRKNIKKLKKDIISTENHTQNPYANDRINGVHRKATKKTRKKYSHKKSFPKKIYAKDSINGGTQDIYYKVKLKINKRFFLLKICNTKNYPKDHFNGRTPESYQEIQFVNKKNSVKNRFDKKKSQRSYQWGTQESY